MHSGIYQRLVTWKALARDVMSAQLTKIKIKSLDGTQNFRNIMTGQLFYGIFHQSRMTFQPGIRYISRPVEHLLGFDRTLRKTKTTRLSPTRSHLDYNNFSCAVCQRRQNLTS